MSKGSFDDNGSQVAYSGSWSSISRAGPFANSLHSTTQSGASATVQFTGVLGRVIGTIPQCISDGDRTTFTIVLDDSTVAQVNQPCHASSNQDGVTFYDTGTLSGGNQQHKLAVVNQGSFPFQLDMFVWAATTGTGTTTTAAAAPISAGNPSTTTISGSSTTATQVSSGSSIGGSSTISTATSMMSGIALGAGVSASSSMQIVTINGVVTSVYVAPASAPTGSLGPNDTHRSSSSSSPRIGLIVGCVIGVLIFIILLIFLLTYCRRGRSKARATTQQPSSPEAITPFQLVDNTTNPSTPLTLYPDLEQRGQNLLTTAQETKIDRFEGSSSPASPHHEADEKHPLSHEEESPQPSSEPQSSTLGESPVDPAPRPPRPPSAVSSFPSDAAPAYRPRYQSDMSTFFNLGVRASLVAEAPPSYIR